MAKDRTRAQGLRELGGVDRVVHEPARLMILMILYGVREADAPFLLNATGLTWGNLSSHVSKLEGAGYVEVDKGFAGKKPRTLLRLTSAGRRAVDDYRQTMQAALKKPAAR
jgi:DNA-binding MarR family transcriptional regulator